MNELPRRKQNRLHNYDYSQRGAYFVTICVKDRHNMLGEVTVGDAPRASRIAYCQPMVSLLMHKFRKLARSILMFLSKIMLLCQIIFICFLSLRAGRAGARPLHGLCNLYIRAFVLQIIGVSVDMLRRGRTGVRPLRGMST